MTLEDSKDNVLGCLTYIAVLLLILLAIGVVGLVLGKIHWELWGQEAAYQQYELQRLACFEEHVDTRGLEFRGVNKDDLIECLTEAPRRGEENYVFPWQ